MKKTVCILVAIASWTVLTSPDVALKAFDLSLKYCIQSIIPSLFCFMVISKVALGVGAVGYISVILRPISKLLKLSDDETSCFVIGNICGFPTGAAAAKEVNMNADYDYRRKVTLGAISNNVSISFAITYIGGVLFCAYKVGILIYLSVLLSSLIVGTVTRKRIVIENEKCLENHNCSFPEVFCSAVTDSASSSLGLTGFIVTFSVISAYLENLFDLIGIPENMGTVAASLLEIGSGCKSVSQFPVSICVPLISFLCGFSGLCVIFQSAVYLIPCGIKIRDYAALKIIQGLIAALISYTVVIITGIKDIGADVMLRSDVNFPVTLIMSLLILVIYLFFRSKRVFSFNS